MNVAGGHVIKERTCICLGIQGPAYSMLYIPRLEKLVVWVHLPNLLKPDPVELGVDILSELEFIHHLLGERTSTALSENCLFGQNLNSPLEVLFHLPLLRNTEIPCRHTLYPSVLIVQDL